MTAMPGEYEAGGGGLYGTAGDYLVFLRMLLNVAVEGVVGAVPVAGDAFDVAFRANRRNVRLLRDYFDGRV